LGKTGAVATRTVGVEEERMLGAPRHGTPASAGDAVHEAAVHRLGADADQLVQR